MILISDFTFLFGFPHWYKQFNITTSIFACYVCFFEKQKFLRDQYHINIHVFSLTLHSNSTQLDFAVLFWVNSRNIDPLTHLPYLNTLDDDGNNDDRPMSEPN